MTTCGKRTFESRSMARRHAREAMATYGGGVLEPYRCDPCGGWHIGHAYPSARPCKFCGNPIVYELLPAGLAPRDAGTGTDHHCPGRRRAARRRNAA